MVLAVSTVNPVERSFFCRNSYVVNYRNWFSRSIFLYIYKQMDS